MTRTFLVAAAVLGLAACSAGSADGAAATDAKAQAKAKPPIKTVFDPQLEALQKAKDVQKTVDDAAKATDKAIDDNGG